MMTEEKAKAYDEALKRANAAIDIAADKDLVKGIVTTIFPELAESEDERIRKALIWHLKAGEDFVSNGVTKEDCITYLEKQKEQKSLNIGAASEWLRKNVCHYMNSEYNEFHKCVEYDGSVDKEKLINDFEEAMQKEQKPADYCSVRDKFDLDGNLKELNYNNRIQYDSIKSGIEAFASTYSFNIESKLFSQLTKEQQQLWREEIEQAAIAGSEYGIELSRDNRYKENRTIEWSEKDKEMIGYIIGSLVSLKYYVQDNTSYSESIKDGILKRIEREQNWLKDLCSSWKPSDQDELMKLKYAGTSTKLD